MSPRKTRRNTAQEIEGNLNMDIANIRAHGFILISETDEERIRAIRERDNLRLVYLEGKGVYRCTFATGDRR